MATNIQTALDPKLAPYLKDCPIGVRYAALLEIGRSFCRDTEVYAYEMDAVATVADQAAYTIVPPSNFEIVRIFKVEVDGTEKNEDLDYTVEPGGILTFETAPTIADLDIVAWGILLPSTAAVFPDWIATEYAEAIRDGALAYLLGMAQHPWYNPQMQAQYERRYMDAVTYAKMRSTEGYRSGSLRVKMRTFV